MAQPNLGGSFHVPLWVILSRLAGASHTITGAIVGIGAAREVAAVRWNVASNLVLAWIPIAPAAALLGRLFTLCQTSFLNHRAGVAF
jgi:inorganic phosphate transporter, PiT family